MRWSAIGPAAACGSLPAQFRMLRQGYDMILVARGRTLTASWKELNDTFLRLCRKLELLEDRS